MVSQMRENQGGFGVTDEGDLVSQMRGLPFQVLRKTRRKTSILKLQSVKSGGSLARNARFGARTCLVSSLWLSRGFAVSMGQAAKPVLLSCCQL